MENKINHIEVFKSTAKAVNQAKEAASGKTSLSNSLAWQAFFILKDGKSADKLELKRLVSKEGELQAFRGIVSKAKATLDAIEEGIELAVIFGKGENEVEILVNDAELSVYSFQNQPNFALSAIYSAIKASDKQQTLEKEVISLARDALMEAHNASDLKEVKELLGEAIFNAQFEAEKDKARASLEAMNKKAVQSPIEIALNALNHLTVDELRQVAINAEAIATALSKAQAA